MGFSAEERRLIDQYLPALSKLPPGMNLATAVERVIAEEIAAAPSGLPAGYVDGLVLEADATDQVEVGAGRCRDDGNTGDIVLASPVTAVLASSLDTGAEAGDTWYYIWLFGDSSGANPTIVRFSISKTSPTLPGGYDLKRRIGSCRNDGSSNIIFFNQTGNRSRRFRYWSEFATSRKVLNAYTGNGVQALDLSAWMPAGATIVDLVANESGTTSGYLLVGTGGIRSHRLTPQAGPENVPQFPVKDSGPAMAVEHNGLGGNLSVWVNGYTDEI